jgi:hypothetical protein
MTTVTTEARIPDRLDAQEFGEHIITLGLLVSNEYAKRVQKIWVETYMQSEEARTIGGWAIDHFVKFGQVTQRDIQAIYMEQIQHGRLDKPKAELIEAALTRINQEWENSGREFNLEYQWSKTKAYFQQRQLVLWHDKVGDLIDRGEQHEALKEALSLQPIPTGEDNSLTTMIMRPVDWLWEQRIPLGKLTLMAGHPDVGKSQLLLDIMARVTSGQKAPGDGGMQHGACLLAATEDDYQDTIIPRLTAAGANLERCFSIGAEAYDIKALSREIDGKVKSLRDRRIRVRMVGIDPLAAYMGERVNTNNDTSVRVALRPLIEVCGTHRLALIAVRHLRKSGVESGTKGASMDLISESKAFAAVARAIYLICTDPQDETRQLMLRMRNALAPPTKTGLAYRIIPQEVWAHTPRGGVTIQSSRLAWVDATVTMTADEAVTVARDQPNLSEAKDWLSEILAKGPMPSKRVIDAGRRAGFKEDTVRRAAEALKVQKRRSGFGGAGGWEWALK